MVAMSGRADVISSVVYIHCTCEALLEVVVPDQVESPVNTSVSPKSASNLKDVSFN